jgi:hypothetical protein
MGELTVYTRRERTCISAALPTMRGLPRQADA